MLRYVLYRAGPLQTILRTVLTLLPRHPEHIDAFSAYVSNYGRSRLTVRVVAALLEQGLPYDYVSGEMWHVVARLGETRGAAATSTVGDAGDPAR